MTDILDRPAALAPATAAASPADERRDALVGRLFQAIGGTMDLLTLYLGDRLGLYRALSEGGPATSAELAARAGTQERYTREWLEQQAVGGILDVDGAAGAAADPLARRYALPAGHAEVLLDGDSLSYLAFAGRFAVSLATTLPAVQTAFRLGGGVSWADFGPDMREAQGAQNRPVFLKLLGQEWLPAIPDVHARLQGGAAGAPARVADFACGAGWSSIGIAQSYPKVEVDGFDLDAPSIALARANAAAAGVSDRVRFHVQDAAGTSLAGRYDLAIICEALHDLSQPVAALQTMRGLLAEDGTALVVDERVAESFTAPGDDLERLFYGFSVLCCLPAGLSEQPSSGTGTVMRPATLRRYALEAGFREVETLPIEHDMFRVYRLRA